MNTTITKSKANTAVRPAIEKIATVGEPSVLIDGCRQTLEKVEGFEYYLVTTDDFSALAPKGSVLNVHTNHEGDYLLPSEIALVAANSRLELRAASECNGAQIIGSVWEIRRWPGLDIERPY